MPLNTVKPAMVDGVLKTSNNLSEVGGSLTTVYDNIGLDTAIPIGCILPYAGTTPPVGWVFCNGQSYSRTLAAALFAVIGTTYGAPDGSSFSVPDLRGRTIIGKDTATNSANRVTTEIDSKVLGAAGGYEDIALTEGSPMALNGEYWNADSNNVQPSIVLNYIIRSGIEFSPV